MNLLIIAPHADDEILGVGGTIAKYVDDGHKVYVCIVTSGHPTMFPESCLKELRREVSRVHEFLGIENTFFLEFPAVLLKEVPMPELNAKLLKLINDLEPNMVFLPHYGDMHSDHRIVSSAAMVGLRPINSHKVLEIYSYETLSETEWNIPSVKNVFLPNTWVDITKYLDKKLEAMGMYATQIKEFPHPRSLEAIESLAKLRGSTIGVHAAEAFSLIRRIII